MMKYHSKGEHMNDIDYISRLYPDFECEHKKRCRQCVYHSTISAGPSLWNVICVYILVTGRRRPCPADECTVFEKGEQRRTISKTWFEQNI